jgi:ABC-type transport system involved in cytochrome bd biosynthesis fused ATPase/permease subunit
VEILHIENLNFRYPKAEKDTLHNISLNIGRLQKLGNSECREYRLGGGGAVQS